MTQYKSQHDYACSVGKEGVAALIAPYRHPVPVSRWVLAWLSNRAPRTDIPVSDELGPTAA